MHLHREGRRPQQGSNTGNNAIEQQIPMRCCLAIDLFSKTFLPLGDNDRGQCREEMGRKRLDSSLSVARGKCPAHSRLAGAQWVLVPWVLWDSGVWGLGAAERSSHRSVSPHHVCAIIQNQRGKLSPKCWDLSQIKHQKMLPPPRCRGRAFSTGELGLVQKLFPSAKCSFLLAHHPPPALSCSQQLLSSESRHTTRRLPDSLSGVC